MAEKKVEEILMEMAHVLCGRYCSCIECDKDFECDYISECSALYKADYRKQSEGEWRSELVRKCDWKGKEHQYYQPNSCSLCHEPVLKRTPFCPHCGAKMKGENNEN